MMNKWSIPVLSALVAVAASIWFYSDLPESIVVHFGTNDQPDRWMSKPFGAFLLPVLILVIPLFVNLSYKLERNENKRRRAEASLGTMMAIISFILLAVHCFILTYNLGYEFSVFTSAAVIVGFVFIVIGNMLPKLPQSTLKWPKLSDDARRRSSRFQGRFMIGAGFVFLLLLLLPEAARHPAFFLVLSVSIVTIIGTTFYYAKQR